MIATTLEFSWPTPREAVRLECDEIHLWCAALSEFTSELQPLNALLSSAEMERAERFRFLKDRHHFVARRGVLRSILGRYLGRPPSKIDFCGGRFGKPEIKGELVRGGLRFSVSHSGDLAVYAVTRTCPIGVDVEYIRPFPHLEEIALRFFSPRETKVLMSLPREHRMEVFFSYWTRKEALLKATGEGIGEGLAKVEVALTPWHEADTIQTVEESEDRIRWQLRSFSPASGYIGAIASRNHYASLSSWKVHTPLC
jgi:4'-phosphopantetheinyl transferase